MKKFYLIIDSSLGQSDHFEYTFKEPLSLDGEWEVGISDICFSSSLRSYYNFISDDGTVDNMINNRLNYPDTAMAMWREMDRFQTNLVIIGELRGRDSYSIQPIQQFYFPTTDSLVTKINQSLKQICVDLKKGINTLYMRFRNHKFSMYNHSGIKILMSPYLTHLLNRKKGNRTIFPFNIQYFTIFSNLVKPQIVGCNWASVLRNIPYDHTKTGSADQNVIFKKPHFHDLSSNHISKIFWYITDEKNWPIQFILGKMHITLEFKQKHRSNPLK